MRSVVIKLFEWPAALCISIVVIVCASYFSLKVFDLTKGHNFSDVGVPMYTHSLEALVWSIVTYFFTIVAVFLFIRWIWKSRDFIYIYGVVNFFMFMAFCFLMMLITG